MVLLYWYPTLMMYKFSKSMKDGLTHSNNELIESGFRYQKNMWRFMDIFTVVIISIYVIVIIAAIIGVTR